MHNADIKRFWAMVDVGNVDDCWNWKASCMRGGYGGFKYYINPLDRKTRKQISAHRFSYIITNGDIPRGLLVCHSCDNPKCCNPKHLFIGTQTDNMRDMVFKGRSGNNSGTRNGRAILDEGKVKDIKKLIANKKTDVEIACIYAVASSTIWQIRRGNNWKNV